MFRIEHSLFSQGTSFERIAMLVLFIALAESVRIGVGSMLSLIIGFSLRLEGETLRRGVGSMMTLFVGQSLRLLDLRGSGDRAFLLELMKRSKNFVLLRG